MIRNENFGKAAVIKPAYGRDIMQAADFDLEGGAGALIP
jgi:hypothetical protein